MRRMGRFTVRRALAFTGALIAGGALALPIAWANNSASTSSATTETGTTATTPPTETTRTETGTTPTTTTSTTPPPSSPSTTPQPAGRPPHIAATSVPRTATTSVLVATGVDPEGLATSYRVQYGPTAAYGSQTGATTVGSGTAEVKTTRTIAGLSPNTTYHFRIAASNSAGATIGGDATFTTAKVPPTLTAAVAPGEVAFGRPLTLSGTASGPESAGVEVVVQEDPYPYDRGFQNVTDPEPVDGAGNFSFSLPGLFESAQLRVATAGKPLAYSAPVSELVRVRVTLHAHRTKRHGYVRLAGTVTPSEPGARVAFERWQHGAYAPISGTEVKGHAGASSRFARIVRIHRPGRYRALVSLAAGALASGRSPAVTVR